MPGKRMIIEQYTEVSGNGSVEERRYAEMQQKGQWFQYGAILIGIVLVMGILLLGSSVAPSAKDAEDRAVEVER